MTPRAKCVYAACLAVHLLLVCAVCCRETAWLIAQGLTIVPFRASAWKVPERVASVASGQSQSLPPALRESLFGYEHLAGIEVGYGFFAPNIPDSYKLIFELHFPDGRTEIDVPSVSSDASGLRFCSFLDKIGRLSDDTVRAAMIGRLTYANWQEHRDVSHVRAILGQVHLPTVAEFRRGAHETYEPLYAYDFGLRRKGELKIE
jgi:hypothetical protein